MKRTITCIAVAALVIVGCRKKKTGTEAVSAPDTARAASSIPGTVTGGARNERAQQTVPTLKGVDANSDLPIVKALAGNDPQAHLRVLNELLMVWNQSQGKPLTSPDDLVKAGFLSKLPNPPPGMKFFYNSKRGVIELSPL